MLLAVEKDHPIVRLEGEVDASNADELARHLEPEASSGGVLALDLDGLSFLDASGVGVLIDTAERLEGRGRLVLCRPTRTVQRVLDVVQADRRNALDVVPAPPGDVVRELFTGLARCDLRALQELVADDATWHVPGNNGFSGDYSGKEEILSLAARMQEATAELLLQVDDVVAANSHVAVVGSVWGDREGKILFGTREMAMFRVEGGIVVEGWTHVFDPAEVDRFWS